METYAINKTCIRDLYMFSNHENVFTYISRTAQIWVVMEITNSIFAAKCLQVIPQAVRQRKTSNMCHNQLIQFIMRLHKKLHKESYEESGKTVPRSKKAVIVRKIHQRVVIQLIAGHAVSNSNTLKRRTKLSGAQN